MPCESTDQSLRIAVTGATGFVGRQLLRDCAARGIKVSALTRQAKPDSDLVRWVTGDLDASDALADLVDGATCVIHLAGATKALQRAEFQKINADATERLAKICAAQNVRHLIFLSSLAATRPTVSPYAASKAAAEEALLTYRDTIDIQTVRAPAVLGPGDGATADLFAKLARGILPVPGGSARKARFSVIDVADLSALLIDLTQTPVGQMEPITPYSHESLGWQDMADSASRVLKRPIRQIVIPAPVLAVAAHVVDFISGITGKAQVFSRDKLREMQSGDWIGRTSVDHPTPLDETLKRCLAPHQNQLITAD